MASPNVAKYLQVVSVHDNLQAIPLRAKDCVPYSFSVNCLKESLINRTVFPYILKFEESL